MADRRNIVVSFRVSGHEAAHLDQAGGVLSVPRGRGDFARAAALYAARQKVPEPAQPIRRPARRQPALDTQTLARILAAVGTIGSDVNQMIRLANASGTLPASSTLTEIAASFAAIRDQITAALRRDQPEAVP